MLATPNIQKTDDSLEETQSLGLTTCSDNTRGPFYNSPSPSPPFGPKSNVAKPSPIAPRNYKLLDDSLLPSVHMISRTRPCRLPVAQDDGYSVLSDSSLAEKSLDGNSGSYKSSELLDSTSPDVFTTIRGSSPLSPPVKNEAPPSPKFGVSYPSIMGVCIDKLTPVNRFKVGESRRLPLWYSDDSGQKVCLSKPVIRDHPFCLQKSCLSRQVVSELRLNTCTKKLYWFTIMILDERWSLNSGASHDRFYGTER